MGSFLRNYFFRLRSSYWFLPSLMAFGAILLSVASVTIDTKIGSSWIDDFSWLYANKPDGARSLLSTIAGSMITVAGVTFSITIVSVTAAAGRFGPRILTNFMGDRGNQVTLGVFIATFIYCLMILRVVRAPEETGVSLFLPQNDPSGAFVPHISILLAILLALASIGVLIYFIHHVTESIHISNVTARIGRSLERQIDSVIAAEKEGDRERGLRSGRQESQELEEIVAQVAEQGVGIRLDQRGYVEQIDGKKILEIAAKHDVTVLILRSPGDFVSYGADVMRVWPPARLGREGREELRTALDLSPQRTSAQDLLFPVDELIEIAIIALSPGINDPYTALTALEWLGSGLLHALEIPKPDPYRYDQEDTLRVILPRLDWVDLVDHVFDRLRPHVVRDPVVARRATELIEEIAARCSSPEQTDCLRSHAERLGAAAEGEEG